MQLQNCSYLFTHDWVESAKFFTFSLASRHVIGRDKGRQGVSVRIPNIRNARDLSALCMLRAGISPLITRVIVSTIKAARFRNNSPFARLNSRTGGGNLPSVAPPRIHLQTTPPRFCPALWIWHLCFTASRSAYKKRCGTNNKSKTRNDALMEKKPFLDQGGFYETFRKYFQVS